MLELSRRVGGSCRHTLHVWIQYGESQEECNVFEKHLLLFFLFFSLQNPNMVAVASSM